MFARLRTASILAILALTSVTAPVLAIVPDNDDIAAPTIIAAVPFTTTQDTSEATAAPTDADCYAPSHTVWFSFTPSEGGWFEADTFGSEYDTTLAVGTSNGSGIDMLGCEDDTFSSQSRVRFEASANTTYLFQVGSYFDSAGGPLVFNLAAIEPPVALEVDLEVEPVGTFTRDGLAILRATVTCNVEAFGYLWGNVRQQVGRTWVTGNTEADVACGPEPQRINLAVVGWNGRFAGGHASVELTVDAMTLDKEAWDSDAFVGTVRLRK